MAVVLSDFLDPAGYESGLTALVGRGFQVDLVQILAPEELSPVDLWRLAAGGFRNRARCRR